MPGFALPLPSSCTSFILVAPYPRIHIYQFLLFKVYLDTISFFSIVTLTASSCYGSVFQRIHSPPCANQELVQISQFLESLKTLFLDSDFCHGSRAYKNILSKIYSTLELKNSYWLFKVMLQLSTKKLKFLGCVNYTEIFLKEPVKD